jgi:lipopolysaccharide transport protein LptA
LRNAAADKRSRLSRQPMSRLASALGAVVALTLFAAVWGEPLWAQILSAPAAHDQYRRSAQPGPSELEKAEKPAVDRIGQWSGDNRRAKAAPSSSKSEGNETPFASLTSSNRGPISIQSDSLALDYKQNTVRFSGHVHATQADGALTSNTLEVEYGKDFHEVKDMAADGNVRISQGVRWCTSDHAVMDQRQHTVILTGTPICHDARDQIAGTRITVHLDSGKSDVEGAKAVIFPQPSKTRDNEALADQAK